MSEKFYDFLRVCTKHTVTTVLPEEDLCHVCKLKKKLADYNAWRKGYHALVEERDELRAKLKSARLSLRTAGTVPGLTDRWVITSTIKEIDKALKGENDE